jgi:hypothetical protein
MNIKDSLNLSMRILYLKGPWQEIFSIMFGLKIFDYEIADLIHSGVNYSFVTRNNP